MREGRRGGLCLKVQWDQVYIYMLMDRFRMWHPRRRPQPQARKGSDLQYMYVQCAARKIRPSPSVRSVLWIAQLRAVPPKHGLSHAEPNYNGKEKPELECPKTSKDNVSDKHQTLQETPHMTASIKRVPMEETITRRIPRGTSCERIKGGIRHLKSCEGCAGLLDDGLSDVATLDEFSLFASAI